jgi:hypothetical protein
LSGLLQSVLALMGQGLSVPSFNKVTFVSAVGVLLGVDVNAVEVVSVTPPVPASPAHQLRALGQNRCGLTAEGFTAA